MRNILFILIMFSQISLFAQADFRKLIDKAGDASTLPGYDQVVVFDSTLVDVQESGLSYVVNHTLTKVITRRGCRDLSTVKFGYDPLSADVNILKAVIHKKDGCFVPIDLNKVLDYPAPARAIYWGAREKMIEIGRLDPGDAVEVVMFRKGFTYALLGGDEDEKYIPPMRGQFYDIVEFFGPVPVKSKIYQITLPRNKPLQYEFYNGEAQVSSKFSVEKMVYTFTKKDIMPVKSEPRMVAQSDIAPKLLLSTTANWFAKSTWFFGVNEEFGSFESTREIKDKVDSILKGSVNELDSVSRLTHWCADEIRYSGISMGPGEGFTLHKGSMTLTDRCGVCKDKAGMLITMLRAAGFKSYPAMTMAGSRIDKIPADQFNHCVTVVKLRDSTYHLLDPTWVPFIRELWSSAEQQQQYLMGIPEGADLATTPVSDPENHLIKIEGVSQLHEDGSLSGRITIWGEGQSDAAIRGMFRGSSQRAWSQNVSRELLKICPQAKISQVKFSDPADYLNFNMWIAIDYTIPEFALVSGKTLLFTPLTAAGIFRTFQGHLSFDTGLKERKFAFRDRCSRKVEIHESITLPPVRQLVRIPETVETKGNVASFEGGYKYINGSLIFSGQAFYKKRLYEGSDWPEFRSAVEAQNKFAQKPVIIEL